jgi:hypothetical protein
MNFQFKQLNVRGAGGALLWGYREVATIASWRIVKINQQWTLTATVRQLDAFQCRQRPGELRFISPHKHGFWCWPVKTLRLGTQSLMATLGPPEQ